MGRNEKNNIILKDNTVSKEYAIIEYHIGSGKLIIKNLNTH